MKMVAFEILPFDSYPLKRAVAQLGRALEWGSRGRGFESRRPDHFMLNDLREKSS
jgi:hypothetical protein